MIDFVWCNRVASDDLFDNIPPILGIVHRSKCCQLVQCRAKAVHIRSSIYTLARRLFRGYVPQRTEYVTCPCQLTLVFHTCQSEISDPNMP